ncbi:hypothetical protein Btru_065994 [Bulinus truncatus]|nr:hypothetical protein Btru_065994 [Bulinus truncatus]
MGRKRKINLDINSKTNLPPCRVCDAPGAGFHYGANTCEACKGFFHRSLKLHEQYRCEGDGQCVITHGLEKLCQMCRYQKCLSVGMGKAAIKTGRYTSVKRTNDILEVKKLQQSGKLKHADSNNSSSSQILRLLISPRADSNSGSQSSCDKPADQYITTIENDDFAQTEVQFSDAISSHISHPANSLMNFAHISSISNDLPVPNMYSNEKDFSEKSLFLQEMEASTSDLSPLAVLSATASAVLTSKTGYSPLTPPETTHLVEPLLPLDSNHVTSPFTPVYDHTASPLSIGISGPSSNSSTASPSCLNSQPASADFLGSFCDSCGCNLENKDISLLYEDKNKVIYTLIEAHESFIVPVFGRLTSEEQLKQQLEHLENCRLHTEIFGTLPRLPDNEYDYIFETTGLDTDGRQHKFYRVSIWMENMIRGMVQFAKAIPGFGKVLTSDKVNLIKYSRQEFCLFSLYNTLNCELRVMRGADNEWKCEHDIVRTGNWPLFRDFVEKHFRFGKTLQNLNLSEVELVIVKAIIIMAPDRFPPVESSIAHDIYWHLIECLLHILSQRRPNANLRFADIVSRLTEARTMTERIPLRFERISNSKKLL